VSLREQAEALVLLRKWLEATGETFSLVDIEELRLKTRQFLQQSPDGAEVA
jgi:chemotaxis regulatin CheY-phosphate phosphatase CheZ